MRAANVRVPATALVMLAVAVLAAQPSRALELEGAALDSLRGSAFLAGAEFSPTSLVRSTRGTTRSVVRLSTGVLALDLRGVEPLLTGQGLRVNRQVVTIGPQLDWEFGRVNVALTGQMMLPATERNGALALRNSGGYGMVAVGFELVRTPALSISPMFGVGASALRLDFANCGRVSVDSLVRDPRTESVVTGRSYIGQAGLSVRASLPYTRHRQHLTLALDLGVISPLSDTKWRRTYDAVEGTPRASLKGSYVRLGAGFTGASAMEALLPTLVSLVPFVR